MLAAVFLIIMKKLNIMESIKGSRMAAGEIRIIFNKVYYTVDRIEAMPEIDPDFDEELRREIEAEEDLPPGALDAQAIADDNPDDFGNDDEDDWNPDDWNDRDENLGAENRPFVSFNDMSADERETFDAENAVDIGNVSADAENIQDSSQREDNYAFLCAAINPSESLLAIIDSIPTLPFIGVFTACLIKQHCKDFGVKLQEQMIGCCLIASGTDPRQMQRLAGTEAARRAFDLYSFINNHRNTTFEPDTLQATMYMATMTSQMYIDIDRIDHGQPRQLHAEDLRLKAEIAESLSPLVPESTLLKTFCQNFNALALDQDMDIKVRVSASGNIEIFKPSAKSPKNDLLI